MAARAVAVVTCDCGHRATPDQFTPGYAVDAWGKSLCYPCAADRDKQKAAAMTPADEPLFCYIRSDRLPGPHSIMQVEIITWAGVLIGTGTVSRGDRSDDQMRVTATIEGRRFWGRTPTHNGTYTRLRPYRDQQRNR